MTDLSAEFKALAEYRPTHKVRFVTAASLFDGHDAAINIMRRILQGMGAEVIHLGHNRSVDEVVTAALQEDVQGIAVSSATRAATSSTSSTWSTCCAQRGGAAHPGVRRRRRRDRAGRDPRAAGLRRRAHLQPRGRPAHGAAGNDRRDGDALRPATCRRTRPSDARRASQGHGEAAWRALAQLITALENGSADARAGQGAARRRRGRARSPVLGITGTGGAGKSSLTDELIRRLRLDQDDALRIAVISHRPVAPQERRRAARRPHPHERDRALAATGHACLHAQPGHARHRQRDQRRAARRDRRVQGRRLRPRDRRDLGHRPGRRGDRAAGRRADVRDDARVRRREPAREDRHARLRRVRRHQQVRPQGRGRRAARRGQAGAAQPRGVRAAARRDAGVRHHGQPLQRRRRDGAVPGAQAAPGRARACRCSDGRLPAVDTRHSTHQTPIVPAARARYLADIADTVRGYKQRAREQAALAREIQQLRAAARMLQADKPDAPRAAEARSTSPAKREARLDAGREEAARAVARRCSRPTPATSTW